MLHGVLNIKKKEKEAGDRVKNIILNSYFENYLNNNDVQQILRNRRIVPYHFFHYNIMKTKIKDDNISSELSIQVQIFNIRKSTSRFLIVSNKLDHKYSMEQYMHKPK